MERTHSLIQNSVLCAGPRLGSERDTVAAEVALGPALMGSQSSKEDRPVPTQQQPRIGRTSGEEAERSAVCSRRLRQRGQG